MPLGNSRLILIRFCRSIAYHLCFALLLSLTAIPSHASALISLFEQFPARLREHYNIRDFAGDLTVPEAQQNGVGSSPTPSMTSLEKLSLEFVTSLAFISCPSKKGSKSQKTSASQVPSFRCQIGAMLMAGYVYGCLRRV